MYARKSGRDCNEGLFLTRAQTDRLIELYKGDIGLWDMSSPVYHNKDRRRKALLSILDTLREEYPGFDATVDQLQYKLSNLRGYYSRELSKIRKSQRMGTDDVYISSWRLFEPLDSFLRQHIIPRKAPTCDVVDLETSCKTEPEDYDTDEELYLVSDETEEQSSNSSLPNHAYHIQQAQEHHHMSMHSEDQSNDPAIYHGTNTMSMVPVISGTRSIVPEIEHRPESSTRMKRPRHSGPETVISETDSLEYDTRIKAKGTRLLTSQSSDRDSMNLNTENKLEEQKLACTDEDDDGLFARYIAMEMRKIKDPRTKAYVKFKIHSIIYESQFGAIPSNINM
ncbi:uncharacterized protein LOC143048262 [Mytilus galloprovincialis]|uniref:uncharacterized protein LOC143048262 n=1 Tax=Mytilus galloprovincialis TaxID=29158 RepID=UPI003F7BB226